MVYNKMEGMNEKLRAKKYGFICIGVGVVFLVIFLIPFLGKEQFGGKDSFVPEVRVALNGITLDEINSGPKRVGYAGNEMILIDGDARRYFNDVEIRGRGNASWLMKKKSYRIKVTEKVDLLGLGKTKKWALISNYADSSLMRNDLGYYIASLLYDDYPIRGEFVRFVVDGEDRGLYYMSKLVSIGKDAIDLRDSLGILVEVDDVYCETSDEYRVAKVMSDCVSVEDVVARENVGEVLDFFMDDYNELEEVIKAGDYSSVVKKADIESWAKYFLLSELSSNPDAYVTSWYLYKDGKNDKIHAGIGWDFDGAFGNEDWWKRDDELYSPVELMTRMRSLVSKWDEYDGNVKRCDLLDGGLISPSMCYLFEMSDFRQLLGKIYREKLMDKREEIISYIHEKADYIRDMAIANNKLWKRGDFDGAVEYLLWWVDKRFDFFDDLFGKMELVSEES